MPLRKKSSASLGGGMCNGGRFYCYGFLLTAFMIGTSLFIDQGITRSLSQPTIRKSADYLTHLPDDMVDQPRMNNNINSEHEQFEEEPNNTNETNNNNTPEIVQVDSIPEKDANLEVEVNDSAVDSVVEDSQAQAKNEKKPRLFLHVGPQKTGSSTFQSMLDKLRADRLSEELKGDNLYYRHIMPETKDFDCELNQWGGYQNCRASDRLKALIRKAQDEGKNLLLTDENLGKEFVTGLRDAIDDNDWDVTVIVMYRRIHEWLFSWYNQINKTTNKDSKGNVLFDEEGIPYRTEHTKWPDQGGAHIPSFSSWYETYTRYWKATELVSNHRSIEYYNLYNESFKNVLLYNMHQEGSMVKTIICNIIGAAHACDKIKSHEIDIEKINGSVHLDHDILSVHAYDQGHITKTLTRKDVVEAVTKYIQESGKVIPRKCDTEMTNQIRNWLVDSEKIVVGDQNWSVAKEKELLQVYESYMIKGRMCDVDKEAILLDDDWLHFLHSLGKNDRRNIVLHVGPIGGASIYETLTTMSGEGQELEKDNYTLVDIDTQVDHFDCIQGDCRASPELKSMFSSLEGTGKNVLILNDNLDERFVEAFKEAIDQRKWNLKVVVGYIRLNQLLFMMYEKEYNYDNLDSNGHFLMGLNDFPNRKKHSKWPNEGGIPIPGFNAWFDAFAQESDIAKIEHLSMHLRDTYTSSFSDVAFYAYHQRDDLVKNFVCKIVPGATQTCKSAKASEAENMNKKTFFSDYTDADILAVEAYEKGLVKKGIAREGVRDAIRNKLRSTEKVLSRICVSKVTKQLYDWMIDSEKAMLGDRFTSKQIAWINKDFQYFLESGKLCALDVEKELQDELWINFFKYNAALQ